MNQTYEFYRVIILIGLGSFCIFLNSPIFTAIGAGVLTFTVLIHISTIVAWAKEDICQSIRETPK